MLISEDVLFIHVPKTAGMSVTTFLLQNLPGEKTLTVPEGHAEQRLSVRVLPGRRHENLPEAEKRLSQLGLKLADFRMILAVIRNPYDLEVSRYHYYRIGHRWDAGPLQDLAKSGDFDRFCREALYPYIRAPLPIESYYTLNGAVPANMRLLRFEDLANDLVSVVSTVGEILYPLGHENVSPRGDWHHMITAKNESYIYEKYRWLFQFYDRFRPQGL